jgi:hypothetical protein
MSANLPDNASILTWYKAIDSCLSTRESPTSGLLVSFVHSVFFSPRYSSSFWPILSNIELNPASLSLPPSPLVRFKLRRRVQWRTQSGPHYNIHTRPVMFRRTLLTILTIMRKATQNYLTSSRNALDIYTFVDFLLFQSAFSFTDNMNLSYWRRN